MLMVPQASRNPTAQSHHVLEGVIIHMLPHSFLLGYVYCLDTCFAYLSNYCTYWQQHYIAVLLCLPDVWSRLGELFAAP